MNRKRIVILNTVIVFGFFAIFFRLTDLMVFNHKIYSERAKSQQVKAEDIQVRRGNIYDRKGRAFAVNLELESLYCDPEEVDKDRLKSVSGILGTDAKLIQAKLSQGKRFTWINRKITTEAAAEIRKLNIKGVGFVPEAKRYYPKGELASHVIGVVGRENQPLEGLELKYDKYLRTSGGKVYFARDASGKQLSSGVDMEAKGNDLVLTIDEGLQYIVETELDNAMAKWKSVAASAIMLDPFTGEILALANRPAYDLNDAGSTNKNAIRNRGITDIYEPGSTFKVIVGTAALEEKLYKLDSTFDCSRGSIEVGGKTIHDAHRHGLLTFKEVIQKSSNVGSIMIGMKLGKEQVYRYAKLYGFGDQTGIDTPGEVSGWIRKPEKWSATSIGAIPIGQEVAVTPLQILRAYSVIANGGNLVQPHLVSEVRTPEGQTLFSFKGETKRIISEKTATVFKDILKTVVEEGGTATEAAVKGNQVAGKTGTAQLIDHSTGRYSKSRFISSFVGFVPADNPKFAMIVVIYEPKGQTYGGLVAGPVFRDIASQALSYMNVPMDENYKKDLFAGVEMILDNIMEGIGTLDISGETGTDISGLSYDSRKVSKGHLFFALPGEHVDGHSFIMNAVERGAAAVVYERPGPYLSCKPVSGVTLIHVRDSRSAIAFASNNFFERPSESLQVIGITGTNGKTTTTYLLKAILEEWGQKAGLIGTIQYMIKDAVYDALHTTPEALEFQALLHKMLAEDCGYVVTEVSSHALAQKRVDGTVFKGAVFTNLTREHLDFHKTMEDYFAAKTRLFTELLDRSSASVINHDDPWGRKLAALLKGMRGDVCTYGIEPGPDLMAADIHDSFNGLRFSIMYHGRKYEVVSSLMGQPNVYNILSAVGASLSLGAPWDVILEGLRKAEPATGRFQKIAAGQKFLAIVDFAHTQDALERLIHTARGLSRGRVITVFGCGGDRDRGKRPVMGGLATRLSDQVIITSDNPRSEKPEEIIKEIESGTVRNNYLLEPDRKEAIKRAVLIAGEEDIVLIAGKGHETYQEIGGKRYAFNDREVLEEAIKQLMKNK